MLLHFGCAIRLASQHLKSNYSAGARKLDAECPFGQRHDCDTCTAPVRYSFRTCSCCASKRVRFQSCASKLPEPCSNLSIFSLCRAVVPAARARAKNCNIRPDERTLERLDDLLLHRAGKDWTTIFGCLSHDASVSLRESRTACMAQPSLPSVGWLCLSDQKLRSCNQEKITAGVRFP